MQRAAFRSLAILSLLSASGVARAQLVTPPTDAPAKTDVLPLPVEDASFALPNAQPSSLPPVRQQPPADAIPPEIDNKWEKLAKRGADGKLIRLTVLAEEAALKVNPAINDEIRKQAEAYLVERRATVERIVIENLDIAEDLASDKLDTIDYGARDGGLKWLTAALKPFTQPIAPSAISIELAKRGVLNPMQAKVNAKIAKEYNDEALKEVIKAASPADGSKMSQLKQVPILVREQAIPESLATRRSLLVEAGKNLSAILPKLGLTGDAAHKATAVAAKLSPTTTDADRLAAIESLREALTIDQRKEMLRQAIALRSPAKK